MTRAMELAPYNPSFLDMRNAILVADTSLYQGRQRSTIWQVFAKRGMGFFAGSFGGNDSQPGASFATPPATLTTGSITGKVTDADTGQPVAGVPVTLAFQGSGVVNPTATTGADGTYTLPTAPVGHYAKLRVFGKGYSDAQAVTVGTPVDFSVHQDLAARSAGASVGTATGAEFAGCGPAQALDQNQATGWSTNVAAGTRVANTNVFHPKTMVVHLSGAVRHRQLRDRPRGELRRRQPARRRAACTIATSTDGVTLH